MTTGAIVYARPPSYLSVKSLARELDMSETHVRDLVEKGILPRPVKMLGSVRWRWNDVQAALSGVPSAASAAQDDPYLMGARNVTSAR